MTRSPTFFRDARQQPPKGLDSHGNPLPEAEPRRVNGYLVKPPMRWTKANNGRLLPLNSDAWRKLRRQVLAEQPLCPECEARGLIEPATQVHHINDNAMDNSRSNLVGLCASCHSRHTAHDMGKRVNHGCDVSGNPINPAHPWNEKSR